ncbi:alpha/beta hydrolase [Actinoplanes bogorensis]|uniref:Alpha/beta hydrolase n=1 Tax=Paractinoplanes bogorensis TaxID=1610840 RepID=A0ABS5Z607_9ACTN|nr:alpha/beta hydrolase [Actinoplanes bogorensis]MBU2671057.1 alpha/beta hydrolase [Actinoplanes bogorensis]
MATTVSADGTPIAYEVHGPADAPAVIYVNGATGYRALHNPSPRIAELTGLRLVAYDRRGRGESGDAPAYSPEREIEDIAALIVALGGRVAAIAGESSGAILALEATRAGVAAGCVIAYEPPFIIDDSRPPLPADYVERLETLDAPGAHRYFATAAIGLPAEFADSIVNAPIWPLLEPVAPTIAYDGRICRDYMTGSAGPLARFAEIAVPVLAAAGDHTAPFLIAGARALADRVPRGEFALIPGATHQTDPELVSRPFAEFIQRAAR